MKQQPKISIVTPSFNQAEFLERTIQSVLSQEYGNLEYIIIDGGSTDGSIDIIKKYESHLHYWLSEPDKGMYDAINKGFSVATGDIMTYINSDDVLHISSFATVVDIFERFPEISWLNGLPNQIDEKDRFVWIGNLPKWNKYLFLNKQFKYIQQEGCFWRNSLWEKAGGAINTHYDLAGDLDLWCRFFEVTSIFYVPTILGSFRVRSHNQKTVERINEYNLEAEKAITAYIQRANKSDIRLVKKYNSILAKLCRKFNSKIFFSIFGYTNIYGLFDSQNTSLKFDRSKQSFNFDSE